MTKVRLDELRAALEQKHQPVEASESAYKRWLVAEVNLLPEAAAQRIEDRYAVGVLDMVIKLPGLPVVWAEGKVIDGFQFGPTPSQFKAGKHWEAAGVECVLIGWKAKQMYVSPWVEKADCRQCHTIMDAPYSEVLREYLK